MICRGQHVLRNPTNERIAECLGLNAHLDQATVHDLVIVGAGPAGLAAAVYGASEGLDVLILEGDDHLERVRWRDSQTGAVETHDVRHVFVMTGAEPNTRWLGGCVALDGNGFIKTGPDLAKEVLAAAGWPLSRPPYLLETSRPGVFAVGDVRAGNQKRVAAAVGEGSTAVAFVHQVLKE